MKSTMIKSVLLLSALAGSGFAEAVTINVPFDFTAAGKTLPAGEYRFDEQAPGVMVITGSAPGTSMLTLTRGSGLGSVDKAGLTFSATKALSSISMPDGKMIELIVK